MKTTTSTIVDKLVEGDLINVQGETYKVLSVTPDLRMLEGGDNVLRNVHVLDVNGKPEQFNLSGYQAIEVTKDDGLAGAPSHVVVDLKDGYVFYRTPEMYREGFTVDSAFAFANERNKDLPSEYQTYQVFSLTHVPF